MGPLLSRALAGRRDEIARLCDALVADLLSLVHEAIASAALPQHALAEQPVSTMPDPRRRRRRAGPRNAVLPSPTSGGMRRARWKIPANEPLLSSFEVAAVLGITHAHVLRDVQEGRLACLPTRGYGGSLLFRWDDVLRRRGAWDRRRAELAAAAARLYFSEPPPDPLTVLIAREPYDLISEEAATLPANRQRALELALAGERLTQIGREIGGVTRERARQVLNRATKLVAGRIAARLRAEARIAAGAPPLLRRRLPQR